MSPGSLEHAHRRLEHLNEISKLLTNFVSVDETVPAVIALVTHTLPLRRATFILAAEGRPRTIAWQAGHQTVGQPAAGEATGGQRAEVSEENLVTLPLVRAQGRIFGTLQLEAAARLDEVDLVFVNSVVNQLAVALDRQSSIEVRDQLDFTRAVTGSLGEGVVAVDIDSRVTLLNAAAEQMLGCTEEEARGNPFPDILRIWRANGEPVSLEECPFSLAMRDQGSIRSEQELFSGRDREAFSVAYTATALRERGQISGAVLAFQDITDRKLAETATAQLAAIVTSSDDAIFSKDLRGIIQTWNRGATRLFGYTAEEAIGKPVNFLMPRNRADEAEQILERVWRGETVKHHETERQRKDGSIVLVSLTVSPIRDATGRAIGASLVARDISYRRAAEGEQKRAETEQRLLTEVATIVASSLDRRATLSAVARCVVPLFADLCLIDEVGEDGLTQRLEVVFAEEAKQRALGDRVRHFTPRPGWRTPQAKALESGKPNFVPEITDPAADGIAQDEEHADAMRASGVRSMIALPLQARGTVLGVLTLVVGDSGRRYSAHDLALAEEVARRVASGLDNARLYEQAQRAIRAREELLAIVSHDLKNPLAVILMSTTLMGMASGDDDRWESRKQIDTIKRSAVRMNRLIQDLLDTASIEAGTLSVERRRLAVAPLVRETLEAMQSLAASKSLQLKSDLPADLPEVSADASRLQQVFTNLLGNAFKFTPDGGTVTVRAEEAEGDIRFSVSDTGPGIPENEVPYLFDRFWQARRTARKGTGLGLSIVKGIVAAHGGRVWVESRLRVGSTFFFTLPAVLHDADDRADSGTALAAQSAETLREEVERHAMELRDLAEDVRRRELRAASQESTRAAQEVATAIESLLQHAFIENVRLATQTWTFDVQEIAVDVIARLRPYAEEKGLELRLSAAPGMTRLTSDPDLTRLILLNLVGSAIELTERGHVEISIERAEGGCTIAVKDSGPGISAEEQAAIFEPVPRRDEPHAAGMCIGFPMVREMAAALGGRVDLDSDLGRGSTFTVTLPSLLHPAHDDHAPLH